jgi:hypothetical protein
LNAPAVGLSTAATRQTSSLRLTLFEDIEIEHRKDWLISKLFGAGEISCTYGFPGCGKSVVLGDAAAHVAAGLPWFGRKVKRGAVLYVAAERGGLVKRRFAAWRKRHKLDGLPIGILEGAFDLVGSPECVDAIVTAARELAEHAGCEIVWIIIDTKARVMGGADPNSDRDIQILVANAMRLQEALGYPHVTIVDHVPHGSPERMKGSGALAGAVDGSFLVRKDGDVRSITVGSKPPNDGPEEFELLFRLESEVVGTDDDGQETTAPVVVAAVTSGVGRPTARPKLPPGAQRILGAYGRLIGEGRCGPAPSVPGVTNGMKAVPLADLQDMAFKVGLCTVPEPGPNSGADARTLWRNSRNQAWKRGFEAAVKVGVLRLEDGLVWDPTMRRSVTVPVTAGDEW